MTHFSSAASHSQTFPGSFVSVSVQSFCSFHPRFFFSSLFRETHETKSQCQATKARTPTRQESSPIPHHSRQRPTTWVLPMSLPTIPLRDSWFHPIRRSHKRHLGMMIAVVFLPTIRRLYRHPVSIIWVPTPSFCWLPFWYWSCHASFKSIRCGGGIVVAETKTSITKRPWMP